MKTISKIFSKLIYRSARFAKHQIVTDSKWTSFDYGHRHSWNPKAMYTSKNGFHKHKINTKKKLAELGGIVPHTHKLL